MKIESVFRLKEILTDKLAGNIFNIYEVCFLEETENMSVPHGAFAAKKVKTNMEKEFYFDNNKPEASRYNSKYMNSIWGMYNRFSVHNLKKMMDKSQGQANAVKGLAATSSLSVSAERLSYLPM